MNILTSKVIKTGAIGVIGTLTTSSIIENTMRTYDSDVQPPIDSTSIIIPSYNEDAFIETTLLSLISQSIVQDYPEFFEFILVDSGSTDKTVEIAKPYIDRILITPRGKLIAKNIAINTSNGNIIVSVDADTYYPYHYLNSLLKPFRYENIVGVNGSTIDYSIPMIPGPVRNILEIIDKIRFPNKMLGRNCAFYKHAYYLAGGYDESINQFSVKDMVQEEEISFGNRLSKIGKVIIKMNASCIHLGGSKIACRWNLKDKDSCKSYGIGIQRFG